MTITNTKLGACLLRACILVILEALDHSKPKPNQTKPNTTQKQQYQQQQQKTTNCLKDQFYRVLILSMSMQYHVSIY